MTSRPWCLVPKDAVPTLTGGFSGGGATIRTYETYEAALEFVASHLRGVSFYVREKRNGEWCPHPLVVSCGDGTTEERP